MVLSMTWVFAVQFRLRLRTVGYRGRSRSTRHEIQIEWRQCLSMEGQGLIPACLPVACLFMTVTAPAAALGLGCRLAELPRSLWLTIQVSLHLAAVALVRVWTFSAKVPRS